jgi:hypothetical protein
MKEPPYFFIGSFMQTIGFLSFWNSQNQRSFNSEFLFFKTGISGCLNAKFQGYFEILKP